MPAVVDESSDRPARNPSRFSFYWGSRSEEEAEPCYYDTQ